MMTDKPICTVHRDACIRRMSPAPRSYVVQTFGWAVAEAHDGLEDLKDAFIAACPALLRPLAKWWFK